MQKHINIIFELFLPMDSFGFCWLVQVVVLMLAKFSLMLLVISLEYICPKLVQIGKVDYTTSRVTHFVYVLSQKDAVSQWSCGWGAECVILRCSCSNMIVTWPDKKWEEKHTLPGQLCTAPHTGHMWGGTAPVQCKRCTLITMHASLRWVYLDSLSVGCFIFQCPTIFFILYCSKCERGMPL